MKKFNVRTILVLDYKERNGPKIFHSSAKLMPSDSGLCNNYACKDWIALDVITKHSSSIYKLRVQLKTAKRKIRDFMIRELQGTKKLF